MNIINFTKNVGKQFTFADWTVTKIYLVIVGIFLAKLFPILTSLHRGYYVAAIVIAWVYFAVRLSSMKK